MKKSRVITGELSFIELYKPTITLFLAALFAVTLAAMTFAVNNAEIYSFEKTAVEEFMSMDSIPEEMLKLQHNAAVPVKIYKIDAGGNWSFIKESDPSFEGHTLNLPVTDDDMAWFAIQENYESILPVLQESLPEGTEVADPGTEEFYQQLSAAGFEYVEADGDNPLLIQAANYSSAPESIPTATGNNHAMATPDSGMVRLYWRSSTAGLVVCWILNADGERKSYATVTDVTLGSHWVIGGAGDIDRDGHPDILWRNNSNGKVAYWLLTSDGILKDYGWVSDTPLSSTIWSIAGMGDIDKDGSADVLWRNSDNGKVAYWFLNADGSLKSAGWVTDTPLFSHWYTAGMGDIDNDGTADLLWRNSDNGKVAYWFLNADGSLKSAGWVTDIPLDETVWTTGGMGDINSDGTMDLFWRNKSNGKLAYWILKNDGTLDSSGWVYTNGVSSSFSIAGISDINSDGTADVIWRNTANGMVYNWILNNDGTLNTFGASFSNGVSTTWAIDAVY